MDADADGSAFVVGTRADDADYDGFVLRLSPAGDAITYQFLVHTTERDEAYAVAVDERGHA